MKRSILLVLLLLLAGGVPSTAWAQGPTRPQRLSPGGTVSCDQEFNLWALHKRGLLSERKLHRLIKAHKNGSYENNVRLSEDWMGKNIWLDRYGNPDHRATRPDGLYYAADDPVPLIADIYSICSHEVECTSRCPRPQKVKFRDSCRNLLEELEKPKPRPPVQQVETPPRTEQRDSPPVRQQDTPPQREEFRPRPRDEEGPSLFPEEKKEKPEYVPEKTPPPLPPVVQQQQQLKVEIHIHPPPAVPRRIEFGALPIMGYSAAPPYVVRSVENIGSISVFGFPSFGGGGGPGFQQAPGLPPGIPRLPPGRGIPPGPVPPRFQPPTDNPRSPTFRPPTGH